MSLDGWKKKRRFSRLQSGYSLSILWCQKRQTWPIEAVNSKLVRIFWETEVLKLALQLIVWLQAHALFSSSLAVFESCTSLVGCAVKLFIQLFQIVANFPPAPPFVYDDVNRKQRLEPAAGFIRPSLPSVSHQIPAIEQVVHSDDTSTGEYYSCSIYRGSVKHQFFFKSRIKFIKI